MERRRDKFANEIIEWYEKNGRDFPWRTMELTPFQFLVAELMLQKTNANQVEKVFVDFIKKYPNCIKILKASLIELQEEFRSLGLFRRRVRDLRKLCKIIVKKNNGFPNSKEDLKKLPGVGEYIARAVSCFAFDQRIPIIDSNVARVISRVFSFPIKGAPSRDKSLAKKMVKLIPKKNYKKFNYGILDFAALICVPRNPDHKICPLKSICDYYQNSN